MIPRLSGDCEGRERIRRNNSVKYYGEIPSVSREAYARQPRMRTERKRKKARRRKLPDPQIFSGGGRDEERYRRWIEQNELGYVERIIPFNDVNRKM